MVDVYYYVSYDYFLVFVSDCFSLVDFCCVVWCRCFIVMVVLLLVVMNVVLSIMLWMWLLLSWRWVSVVKFRL